MKARVRFMAMTLALLFGGRVDVVAQEASSQPAATQSAPTIRAIRIAGMADRGVFYIYKDDERLATIEHEWFNDGKLVSHAELSIGGQSVRFSTRITPNDSGAWERIDQDTPIGAVEVVLSGPGITLSHAGKTVTVALRDNAVLFENNTPALMSMIVREYDAAKGGKQSFPLFVIPQSMVTSTLERLDTVQRSFGGRDQEFTRYTLGIPGVDITLWADAAGKVCLADVPSQHAAYVREGFEALREKPIDDPLLSQPTFEVREQRGVMIPTRDGTQLSADIYQPVTDAKTPVILIRTPYKKEMNEIEGKYYARRGYTVAIQDVRGRFGSSGTWEAFINEGRDGYDAIEWLAAQPWCDGKVGMIGASYVGWVQWWAAAEKPPHLVTIIPNVSPPDPFYNIPYEYGVFFLMGSIWWAEIVESEATADVSGSAMSKISEHKYTQLLKELPVIGLDRKVLGKENHSWRKWIEHNTLDSYWEPACFLDRLQDVRIPVFHQSGWFDGDGIGSKLNYLRMASHGHPNQKLILGPWGHTNQATRIAGDRDFGPEAIVDLSRDYLRWFDYWLKGVDNGINKEPFVSLFVMGTNKWLHGDSYPLPQTRFEKWYFSSAGNANTSKGDGVLTLEAPAADAPPDQYRYDPADPTPAPELYDEPDATSSAPVALEAKQKAAVAYHESIAQTRRDMLVYTTPALEKPLTFVGPLSVVLYASSSCKDTDWFARLVEISETGKLYILAEGKIRARFRESMRKPTFLEPGKVYEYTLDLWQTGITIPAGRRLRVEVSSASFPMFSRNLNTGGHNEKDTDFVAAEQTIYHDAARPSHLLLPVIPD